MKFYITEKQNLHSQCAGEIITAKDLTQAKRKATKKQCFCGTVLTIEDELQAELYAYKKAGESWTTC